MFYGKLVGNSNIFTTQNFQMAYMNLESVIVKA